MKCPFIWGKKLLSCSAHEKADIYVPSIFELEEYCKTARHARCPLQRAGRERSAQNRMRKDAVLKW